MGLTALGGIGSPEYAKIREEKAAKLTAQVVEVAVEPKAVSAEVAEPEAAVVAPTEVAEPEAVVVAPTEVAEPEAAVVAPTSQQTDKAHDKPQTPECSVVKPVKAAGSAIASGFHCASASHSAALYLFASTTNTQVNLSSRRQLAAVAPVGVSSTSEKMQFNQPGAAGVEEDSLYRYLVVVAEAAAAPELLPHKATSSPAASAKATEEVAPGAEKAVPAAKKAAPTAEEAVPTEAASAEQVAPAVEDAPLSPRDPLDEKFEQHYNEQQQHAGNLPVLSEETMRADAEKIFASANGQFEGILSKSAVKNLLKANETLRELLLGGGGYGPFFAEIDKNGDGSIELEEFVKYYVKKLGAPVEQQAESADEPVNPVTMIKNAITRIYEEHRKSQLGKLPELFEKNVGKEHELYSTICDRFGVTPDASLQ